MGGQLPSIPSYVRQSTFFNTSHSLNRTLYMRRNHWILNFIACSALYINSLAFLYVATTPKRNIVLRKCEQQLFDRSNNWFSNYSFSNKDHRKTTCHRGYFIRGKNENYYITQYIKIPGLCFTHKMLLLTLKMIAWNNEQ